MLGNFACFLSTVFGFFKKKFSFSKTSFRNTIRVSQKFESRSGPIKTSDLIRIQTVCKDYQQMTKVATSKVRFKWIVPKSHMVMCDRSFSHGQKANLIQTKVGENIPFDVHPMTTNQTAHLFCMHGYPKCIQRRF